MQKEISVTDEVTDFDVKIEAYGATLKVLLGEECIIEHTDDTPILNGAVGIMNSKVSVKKIKIDT